MESYSVEAVLSAVDKGFSSSMRGAERSLGGLQSAAGKSTASIGKIATGIGVFKAVSAAGSFVTNAISGLSGELAQGSKTWKTYTGNMENLGKSKKEISSVKKELMDYATQTIYSASDMATTYSQLTAVGIKGSNQLVKGFGGLAAAAENPKQAMKTLSQQATQMAAKPTVQWQDFKLMLEQTPAGIAAVAKEMGMSTAEMVKSVQDGTIKTEDFFNAVKKVGTNKAFSKMATQYKSVDEAMDGLQETITNKLQPAYDKFSQFAIDGIEKVIEVVDKLNFDKWIGDINSVDDLVQKVMPTLVKFGSVLGAGILASGSAPFLEKMPSIFSSMADKGGLAAKSIGDIAGRAKELSGKANLTNFAKGFETARSKLGGFKIGMLDVGEVFDNVDNTILKTSSKLISLSDEFPELGKAASIAGKSFGGISTGLETATSVGTTVLSGFMSSITSIVGIALRLVAPAAIIGVVLAGFGLAMDQFGTQINSFIQDVAVKGPQVISGFADGIGAKLGNPTKQVVVFVGDGGFQMTNQEFAILNEHQLAIKFILLNNSSLGMVRQWQEVFFDNRRSQSVFENSPDFVMLAKAYGIEADRVDDPETMEADFTTAFNKPGPGLIEVVVSATEHVLPMIPPGKANDQMMGVD